MGQTNLGEIKRSVAGDRHKLVILLLLQARWSKVEGCAQRSSDRRLYPGLSPAALHRHPDSWSQAGQEVGGSQHGDIRRHGYRRGEGEEVVDMRRSPLESGTRAARRAPARFFLFFITVVILPLLVGCGEERSANVRVEYQPPVIPLQVSIDTNGEITFSTSGMEIPTPLGKFRAGIEVRQAVRFNEVKSTLTIRFDGQDHVYDLHGRDFDIDFKQGYYEKVAITKAGSHILLELRRAAETPVAVRPINSSTPTRRVSGQTATLETSTTRAPVPTNTPRPTATPIPVVCNIRVDDRFRNLWERAGGTSVGCPQDQAYTRRVAYQPFQNGSMYWLAGPSGDAGGLIYVLYNSGSWQEYSDNWVEGMAESVGHSPPAGLTEPRRGFGYLWGQLGGPNAHIGWALQDETGSDFGLLQPFPNNAVIFQFPDQPPIFMPDGKKWVR